MSQKLNFILADPHAEPGVLVCTSPHRNAFADDVAANCTDCGVPIMHRPHATAFARKVCMACGMKLMGTGKRQVSITRETLADLRLYYGKAGGRA